MKPILNEQLARMQKLAGIITENVNEAITLDPNKLKAFTMAVNTFGGSRGDKADFLKIAKLLSSNQLAKAADAIQLVDTSPRELMYDIMMDTYPELWDMLFDNEEGDYIALATPKAGLPENQINEDDIFNNQYSISDEAYERMDGLVNENDYDNFIRSATNIMTTLTDDGFEAKEIFYYLYTRLTAEV
jgi:hypothetical protein